MRRSALSRNHYFVFGILVGLALSFYLPEDVWDLVQKEECPQEAAENSLIEKFGEEFEPHLNLISKPLAAKKPATNVIRPRYYSSELGIREKIFIGVMTSQDNINTLATAINRTTAHLVNKIKFFINADNVKTNYKLKNIVGFTDTRESLRPFHVIKYIADNYLDDYDYFLIMPDTVYVDARKLKALLYHISITFDLYMGARLEQNIVDGGDSAAAAAAAASRRISNSNGVDDLGSQSDRNYCDLNAGILLSSSVIRKMRNNLDWCVRNGVSNVHSVNIGRCVKYSSNLSGCQTSFQGVHEDIYGLQPHMKLFKDLNILARDEAFRKATAVYPVTSMDDFYRLHAYYSRHHLELVQQRSFDLERKSYQIANGSISNNILEIRWPLGVPLGSAPETRHDIITWHLINSTHIFLPNAENIVEPLSHTDKLDFDKVLEIAIAYGKRKHPHLQYVDLHTVYRKFDATRGMDYQFHLNMRDTTRYSDELVTQSFQVVKPLGRVEVIPSPYVTESTRIAIMVPTFEHQAADGVNFITEYERICMQNQDNTFLLMIFLYRYDSISKGEQDPFKSLKTLALDLSTKYKSDGSRIAWVSIRLPPMLSDKPPPPEDIMLNSIYGRNDILSVAVADLALPKIGLDSLVLMASTDISFKADFLNRVRMNTIQGFQIYSPIGFMMYPCRLAHFCKQCESCDVSQSSGYFDKWNYDLIAFYSRDYVQARKLIESTLPITRTDNDIELLLSRSDHNINTILDMFVASQLSVHILRGTEPNLRYGYAIRNHISKGGEVPTCPALQANIAVSRNKEQQELYNEIPQRYDALRAERDTAHAYGLDSRKCIHLASRKQIGDAIIRFEDRSILHK
ncbi:chondroitin sulfate glucuronyltransferase [Bactrocera neohumeralis]|uniref:chondroitin sulfate glucuronyltransferase n=1 Tax=Bactrocera neohumeralis TaxID=98809 RepID=UPI002164F80E|nr:chondroitin sulfate glucuronyltransferase [Bactrocera neohumeralis]